MAMVTTRKEQKERTRRGLVLAATDLFRARGIVGTTTADVAKACDVSHGTLFVHFETREDLIATVIDDFGAALGTALTAAVAQESNLKGVLTAHLRVLEQFESFYFRLITELHSLPAAVKSSIFMLHAAVSWHMYSVVQADMKAGVLKKVPRDLMFNTWLALVHHYLSNRDVFAAKESVLKERRDELIRHFLHLMKA